MTHGAAALPNRAAAGDAAAVRELDFARDRKLRPHGNGWDPIWNWTMTSSSPATSKRPSQHSRPRLPTDRNGGSTAGACQGLQRVLLFVACGLGVAVISLLDRGTDSHLSLSLLYLLPVTACAWCGGFSDGILLSLGGSVAWHLVDWAENPALPPSVRVWNGVIRFGTLALMSSLVSRLRISIVRERLLARTDALTGAANGRTFYETAEAEAERSRRSERPLTLAYFDLDNFKQLNDRRGHVAGDEALRSVVHTIQLHLRNADVLARLGGDEFALLLPETGSGGRHVPAGALAGASGPGIAPQGPAGDAERRRRDVPAAPGGHRPDDPAGGWR